MRSILTKQRRKEGQKTVWFKESADSSDIEVEIIPDTVGRVEEETEEELEGEVEMEGVVRDPAAPLRESDGGQESTEPSEEQDHEKNSSDIKEGSQEKEGWQQRSEVKLELEEKFMNSSCLFSCHFLETTAWNWGLCSPGSFNWSGYLSDLKSRFKDPKSIYFLLWVS